MVFFFFLLEYLFVVFLHTLFLLKWSLKCSPLINVNWGLMYDTLFIYTQAITLLLYGSEDL